MEIALGGLLLVLALYAVVIGGIGYGVYRLIRRAIRKELEARDARTGNQDHR